VADYRQVPAGGDQAGRLLTQQGSPVNAAT
jgi:hypothetical protein